MPTEDPRRQYIIRFRKLREFYQRTRLPEQDCVDAALMVVKSEIELSEEHQRDVDNFLAKEIKLNNSWQSTEASGSVHVDFEVE